VTNLESNDIATKNHTILSADDEAKSSDSTHSVVIDDNGKNASRPTEEEKHTLRKVAGSIPRVAYWLCAVEFAERASYYGVQPLFGNFVKNKLPKNGNGWGAPSKSDLSGKAGALGLGSSKSNAITQSFSMFVYMFPIFWGWLSDQHTGRWKLICWGVAVCGVAHAIMVGAAAPALLQAGHAVAPFLISVYLLAIGAGKFSFKVAKPKTNVIFSHVQALHIANPFGSDATYRACD
jgi:dipeptide/tripeptide permease